MANVLERTRDQVIHGRDPITLAQKPLTKMGTEETGAARYHDMLSTTRACHFFQYQSTVFCRPSSKPTRGFHLISRRIRLTSAQVRSGSPGRRGPCTGLSREPVIL